MPQARAQQLRGPGPEQSGDARSPAPGRLRRIELVRRQRSGGDLPTVVVVDELPAGVTLVSASSTIGTVVTADGYVTCTIDQLPVTVSMPEFLTIEVVPTTTETLINRAWISGCIVPTDNRFFACCLPRFAIR